MAPSNSAIWESGSAGGGGGALSVHAAAMNRAVSAASCGMSACLRARATPIACSAERSRSSIASRRTSCCTVGSPCRARLCFSLKRPLRMSSCTLAGSFSVPSNWKSRLRRIPTISATSSQGASLSCCFRVRSAAARSTAFRSSRTIFSMSCCSSRRSTGTSRTIAGMVVSPAACAARKRRSPWITM